MLPNGFAWHCGNVSVRRSFNGGQSWYKVGNFGVGEPDHARFVSFADENRGLIATDKLLESRVTPSLSRGMRAAPGRDPQEDDMKPLVSMLLCLVGAGCATTTTARLHLPELQTVPHLDLGRYLGTWYEIANFPQSFQRGCTATTATYTRGDDGQIEVVNRCRKGSPDGPEEVARGRARIVDPSSNAKLEVSFFRPFWGDYWVIDLGAEYEYAVVGHPSRDYLWILSRTPTMKADVYEAIVQRLAAQGYGTNRLVRTVHGPAPEKSNGPI